MSKYIFTDAEVRQVVEQSGFEYSETSEWKQITGLPEYARGELTWKVQWQGDLTMDEQGQLNVMGIVNLRQLLEWRLLALRRQPVVGFQVSEYTDPEDFAKIAKAAGMRLVCESGFTPWSVNFVPDVARAGEIQWLRGDDKLGLHEALLADPAEEPVVIRKSELARLVAIIGRATQHDAGAFIDSDDEDFIAEISKKLS